MKPDNASALERLSLYTHFCGVFSVFLGILVVALDVLRNDMSHVQVGIYIVITGYAFVKVSSTLARVVLSEKLPFSKDQ